MVLGAIALLVFCFTNGNETPEETSRTAVEEISPLELLPDKALKEKMEESEKAMENAPFVGSRRSDVYHFPSCKWVEKIKRENIRGFKSEEEAIEFGYRRCVNCLQ